MSKPERSAAYTGALEDVEEAAREISKWDSLLIRPIMPEPLMSNLDQALNEVTRIREVEADAA